MAVYFGRPGIENRPLIWCMQGLVTFGFVCREGGMTSDWLIKIQINCPGKFAVSHS